MKEVMDERTGAILFKPDPKDQNEVEIIRLKKKVDSLEKELKSIKELLSKVLGV